MKTGLLCFLSLALFFVTYSREVTEEEMIWLKSREDLVDMANVEHSIIYIDCVECNRES